MCIGKKEFDLLEMLENYPENWTFEKLKYGRISAYFLKKRVLRNRKREEETRKGKNFYIIKKRKSSLKGLYS